MATFRRSAETLVDLETAVEVVAREESLHFAGFAGVGWSTLDTEVLGRRFVEPQGSDSTRFGSVRVVARS